MRALVIHNDVGTIGVSIIATLANDDDWRETERLMEDEIGALRDIEAVAEKVSNFTILFPLHKFHRGMVYGNIDKTVIDVVEEDADVITGRGYKIDNPPQIKVEFKAVVAELVDA